MKLSDSLRITEIFHSIQGESTFVGLPTVFIRLTGCPLRCQYCDTAYAFSGGEKLSLATIMEKVASYKTNHITVTGGEPLAQSNCFKLLTQLCDANYTVSLETSGAMAIKNIHERVHIIMDIKTPGSMEENKNHYENIHYLKATDQVKFVICDEQDYHWSKNIIKKYDLGNHCQILWSPSYQQLPPKQLAEWILADNVPGRLQLQMHKIIWGDVAGV